MELFYYHHVNGNVGDDLNPWLWPKVFGPDFFQPGPQEHVFFGIGSILTSGEMGSRKRYTIFGTGARSFFRKIKLDGREFDIRFVRGPLTSSKCGDSAWITDSAAIVPRYFTPPERTARKRIGFVPYYKTPQNFVDLFCERLGMYHLSPKLGVEEFINGLCSCDEIVAEAMHGAILADAYRIPWRAVRLTAPIHEGLTALFKWSDWLKSLNICKEAVDPYPLISFLPNRARSPFLESYVERRIEKYARAFQPGRGFLSDSCRLQNAQDRIEDEARKLILDKKLQQPQ